MASFNQRIKITKRHEYIIPAPANWVEVSKAMSAAQQDMKAAKRDYKVDDAAWFIGGDEDIILYWEEEVKP